MLQQGKVILHPFDQRLRVRQCRMQSHRLRTVSSEWPSDSICAMYSRTGWINALTLVGLPAPSWIVPTLFFRANAMRPLP